MARGSSLGCRVVAIVALLADEAVDEDADGGGTQDTEDQAEHEASRAGALDASAINPLFASFSACVCLNFFSLGDGIIGGVGCGLSRIEGLFSRL